ncbi:MAG: hypothetical protein JWL99_2592, partial [Streptomyces oryziradicis]|nr:hypothetical protein [Actinacidiphila oryziradicis]
MIGDGFVTSTPGSALVEQFRKSGGVGKPVINGTKPRPRQGGRA